jgi:hypothetical protein
MSLEQKPSERRSSSVELRSVLVVMPASAYEPTSQVLNEHAPTAERSGSLLTAPQSLNSGGVPKPGRMATGMSQRDTF